MTDERVTYITQLESRIDELKHVIRDTEDDLAATITAQTRRIAELEAELTGVIDGHTAATELTAKIDLAKDRMIAVRDARIAELEAALHDTTAQLATATENIARLEQEVKGYRLSAAAMEGAYVTSDDEATKLKATVQRLEQDNRRLRHLDAMPVDAMLDVVTTCMYNAQVGANGGLDAEQFIAARKEAFAWLDGAA